MLPPEYRLFAIHSEFIGAELAKCLVRVDVLYAALTAPVDGEFRHWNPRLDYFTAFLCTHRGQVLLLTAGHNVVNLHKRTTRSKVVSFYLSWAGPGQGASKTVQVAPRDFEAAFVHDPSSGLDMASLSVAPSALLALIEVGAVPAHTGAAPDEFSPQMLVVLGLPLDHAVDGFEVLDSENCTIRTRSRVACIPLEPISARSDTCHPTISGRVLARTGTENGAVIGHVGLNGCSGGPMFAIDLRKNGFTRKLIGIQSTEDRLSDTAFACSVSQATSILVDQVSPFEFHAMEELRARSLHFGS